MLILHRSLPVPAEEASTCGQHSTDFPHVRYLRPPATRFMIQPSAKAAAPDTHNALSLACEGTPSLPSGSWGRAGWRVWLVMIKWHKILTQIGDTRRMRDGLMTGCKSQSPSYSLIRRGVAAARVYLVPTGLINVSHLREPECGE